MNLTKRLAALSTAFALAAITFSLAVCAQAQTVTTLANFDGRHGAYVSHGSLVQGTDGNYYGTTQFGGKTNGGVFFQVTPSGVLTDIYNFCHTLINCADGRSPWAAPVLATDGNFYGTTSSGGNSEQAGTIYKITRGGTLTTLYSFCPTKLCSDGKYPLALMQASNGNFYGVTSNFGLYNNGTIFEFSRSGVFTVLYSFCPQSNCSDGGSQPRSGLMQASNGNLYGTTFTGGANGNGTVYEISPAGLFRTIHDFCAQSLCADGASPTAGLVEDAHGNFYGTTYYGGANSFGSVFEITAAGQFIVLHSFDNTAGSYPSSALILASDGNLYGATYDSSTFAGTIFQITAAHVFGSLYSFCTQSGCAGANPLGTLFQATAGAFYGTTSYGGPSNDGTIFTFSMGLPPLIETIPTAAKVGAHVTILGDRLTGSTGVRFHGTAASFKVVSNTEITATVPTGATTGTITVTTSIGTLRSNPAFQVLP